MKATFAEFKEYLANAGLTLTRDEEFADHDVQVWTVPNDHIITVNGKAIETGVEVFGADVDEIYEPNTIRCIHNIDSEDITTFTPSHKVEWAVYKKII